MSLPSTPGFVGDWVVGSRTVHVASTTRIDQEDGVVAVGALVEIRSTLRSDGSVDATGIEVEQPAAQCFEFTAVIQALPGTAGFIGDWTVGGLIVHVTPSTTIDTEEGAVAVGKLVEVEGCRRTDGSIDASKIEVKENEHLDCIEFDGVIESLPASGLIGDWTVSGRVIHVTSETLIKVESGAVVVGAFVETEGCPRGDGSIDAGKIEVEQQEEVPRPFPFAIFFGVVQTLPPSPFTGDWNVNGRTVHVTSSTRIDRPSSLSVGSFVLVLGGLRTDGTIDAVRIEVRQPNDFNKKNNFFELFGTVQSRPSSGVIGDWMISNVIVHVSSATQFNDEHGGRILVGDKVVVVGTQRTNLTLDAARIHRVREFDDVEDFVTQHYHDFLTRDPDPPGLAAWVNTINICSGDMTQCDRVHVSEMFFKSAEFQERGYFVYRFYSAAFGRKPDYAEFVPDLANVSGFLTNDQLEVAKVTFANGFASRPAFVAKFGSLDNQHFVDALLTTVGVTMSSRQSMIDGLNNNTLTRAQALRKIAESGEVQQKYYNQAFVVMEYFGYLRRDPDILYLNWISALDSGAVSRTMVTGFVNSAEYRQRFGP
ncbi:MAG TPA: DUF5666 domain-containing protein [Pyrinomonadaceae bacterium]|nr:DUF5666 domain-containing protein [Pyrinomonadaceae bacterium]